MNSESVTDLADIDISHHEPSEASSASPVYSGSSEMQDDVSSVETTPPPALEEYPVPDSKRYSASSNGFSRSYRSVASSSYVDSVFSPGLLPQRLSGVEFRPLTSGTDDGNLAAATADLHVTGTPKTKPFAADDIPPVPPLPQQYQSYSKSASLSHMHNPFSLHPPSLTQQISDERNYRGDQESRSKYNSSSSHLDEEPMFLMD